MAQQKDAHVRCGQTQANRRRQFFKGHIGIKFTAEQIAQIHVARHNAARRKRQNELAGEVAHHLHGAILVEEHVCAEQLHAIGHEIRMDACGAEVIIKRHVQMGLFQQGSGRLCLLGIHRSIDDQTEVRRQVDLIASGVAVRNDGRGQFARRIAAFRQRRRRGQQHRRAQKQGKHTIFQAHGFLLVFFLWIYGFSMPSAIFSFVSGFICL